MSQPAETESELNTLFDTERGPLARAVLLQHGAEDAHLLLTVHHCFAGGRSVFYLLRDLIRAAAGEDPGGPAFDDTTPLAARMPESLGRRARFGRIARFVLHELALGTRHGKPVKVARDGEAKAGDRVARLIHRVLAPVETAALVARARVFVDSRTGAMSEAGDLLLPMREGAIDENHIAGELGQLAAGGIIGRRAATDVTLFKSLGMAIEDVAAAHLAFERATERGLGRGIPW